VPVLGAALSAVLSSGLTAAYLRTRPEPVVPAVGEWVVAPERTHPMALLAAPDQPWRPVSDGKALTVAAPGFVTGWTRAWRTPRERVDSSVLEFASPADAAAYAGGVGRAAPLLIDPAPFVVPGVPTASGLSDRSKARDGRYAHVIALHRGKRAALLLFAVDSARPSPLVVALAQRQYAALAAP
jgi:hypothetical protein